MTAPASITPHPAPSSWRSAARWSRSPLRTAWSREEVGATNQPIHLRELYKLGVVLSPNLQLTEIYREGNKLVAVLRNEFTHEEEERLVDQIVVEFGTLPNDALYFDLKERSINRGEMDLHALVEGRPQPHKANGHGGSSPLSHRRQRGGPQYPRGDLRRRPPVQGPVRAR